jgi:predicted metal-binding membrane protein
MHGMHMEMSSPHAHAWGVSGFLSAFAMWSVMMVGMMLPSASPMILTFSSLERRRSDARPFARTGLFVLGYAIVWTGYSALAAFAQGVFQAAAVLSPMGASMSPYLAGGLLLVAGAFQLTPFKYACLDRCRTPVGFLMAEWRPGSGGALKMGLRHGAYCAGCCWAIMALMFVLGVMNLLWMAALAAFMLLEKVVPAGHRVGRVAGVLLMIWGASAVASVL